MSEGDSEQSLRELLSELKEISQTGSPGSRSSPQELLRKNRDLQVELHRIVSAAESVRRKNDEMRRLCDTVIQTRQQQPKQQRTARPVKAPSSDFCPDPI